MRHVTRCGLGLSLSLLALATAAAQTPPSAPVFRAVTTEAPANRITLSVDQVRALMIAHHREVAAGTSEDNTVTIVLSSSGEYVASGQSKAVSMVRAVPSAAGAAGVVVAAGAGGAGAGTGGAAAGAGGGGAVVAGFARTGQAEIVALPASAAGAPRMMTLAGIGEVDPRLIQDMYFQTYEPGEVSMNAIRIRFVTLTGRAMKF